MLILLYDVLIYIILSSFISWIFYFVYKKELLGGFIGGFIVAIAGSILGSLFGPYIKVITLFLLNGMYISHVNVIAALISGYLAVFVFNKINHDKQRPY